MPVVPMTIISSALLVLVSCLTSKPSSTTVERYFSGSSGKRSAI
jgi:hypothetical protein